MLIGIKDKQTGRTYHVCGGFPSASGKTNLAMMVPPAALRDRYEVEFFGDDIAWLNVDPTDGRIYAMNPEFGVFGVAKDTNEVSNPTAIESIAPGTHTLFTNVAYNRQGGRLVGGQDARLPGRRLDGWLDWKGHPITDRSALERRRRRLGPPQQPLHDDPGQRAQRQPGLRRPARCADRRDHLRRARA